jgi:scyllo-inositol 2-dehydrogenase (NADP+)
VDALRVALVGYGLSGAVFHGPLIAAAPGLTVTSVVTRNAERQARAGRDHPGARVLSSPTELWERAAEHDLVVVATANQAHVALATEALDHGLAVVVDKPLAPTASEARALVEHARTRGKPLVPFHNRRWDSDHLTAAKLQSSDALGKVLRYESRFERWRPQLNRTGVWRESVPPVHGGGVLLDLGPHLVDQALVLLGEVSAVYGEVHHRRAGPADDDAFLALSHRSGAISHLWASAVAAAPGPRLRVLGSEAAYVVDGVDGQEEALRAGRRPGEPGSWGTEPEAAWGRLVRGSEAEPVPSQPGAWPTFYAELAQSLRTGGPPPVPARAAIEGLRVLEAARRSSERGEVVSLQPGGP